LLSSEFVVAENGFEDFKRLVMHHPNDSLQPCGQIRQLVRNSGIKTIP
jgi:hypothetical protein